MKKVMLCVLLAYLVVFVGCHGGVPVETTQPATVPVVATEPTAEPTMPTETTPLETIPPETAPPETTEPPREYVPQDPDTTAYPEDKIQATLSYFSGMLYVNDNRTGALVEELPSDYIYIGVSSGGGPSTRIPRWALVTCNVADRTEFYGCMDNPDYIYYALDGKYRRMIRAGLVENYWDDQQIDPEVPENYTELFFESLLNATFSENRYHCATYSEFDRPEDVDLYYLFYSGFYKERQKEITEAEERFLLSDGWDGMYPKYHAKRLPAWLIDADLRRFFGIGYYDLSGVGMDLWKSYWAETGCYYIWRSDTIGSPLTVDEVIYDENSGIYTVTYTMELHGTKVMRLRLVGDAFQVLSNKTK